MSPHRNSPFEPTRAHQPPKSPPVYVRVQGKQGLFCDPHLRADPHSLSFITVSAAAGLLGSLYVKRGGFEWEIEKIISLTPPCFETVKQIGRKTGGTRKNDLTRISVTYLKDLDYIIQARMVRNVEWGSKSIQNYYAEACRRLDKHQEFRTPHFGRAVYPLSQWDRLQASEVPKVGIDLDLDLGSVPFEMTPINISKDQWRCEFWRASVVHGVLSVPEALYAKRRPTIFAARIKVTPDRSRNPDGTPNPAFNPVEE